MIVKEEDLEASGHDEDELTCPAMYTPVGLDSEDYQEIHVYGATLDGDRELATRRILVMRMRDCGAALTDDPREPRDS